jgi:hypothetical protein
MWLPLMVLARQTIFIALGSFVHTNGKLVDVGLATPLSLSFRLATASRLLPPRSGLERSDFVLFR